VRSDEAYLCAEPKLSAEAARVFRRAFRRRVITLTVALLVTGTAVAVVVLRRPAFTAALVFQFAEGDLQDGRTAPRSSAAIRDTITAAALDLENLLSILEKYGLLRQVGRAEAIATARKLREGIQVAVVRNDFLLDRASAGELRAAQVVVSYSSYYRDFARAVVHDIGAHIVRAQAAARAAHLQHALRAAEREAERVDEELRAERQDAIAGKDRHRAPAALRSRAEAAGAARDFEDALSRSEAIRARAAELAFATAADERQLLMDMKLVDESVTMIHPPLSAGELALYSIAVFSAALLVSCVVVGAFDRRVYQRNDVTALGISLLGALERFEGDSAGPYRSRCRAAAGEAMT
jgi:hypothetical protein